MVDWPTPYTISETVRSLKRSFIESFGGDDESDKEQDLNYIVAVSSGKAVTEEIPDQIGRRAGWASQQGANFVEILIENPSQLMMDSEMLINLARQLNLHYNVHSSTNLAYGMSYRRERGNGFDSSHEYTVKLLKAIRRFREGLETNGEALDQNGHPRLYAVNGHMAVAQFPQEEEQLARDVSVGPYGEAIEESKILESSKAREQLWVSYLRPMIMEERRLFQAVLDELGLLGDFSDKQRELLLERLIDRGHLPDADTAAQKYDIDYAELDQNQITQHARQDLPADPRDPEDTEIAYDGIERADLRDMRNQAEEDAEDHAYELARDAVSESKDNMKDVTRLAQIQREMWKESHVFRRIIPYWMPHAQDEQVVQMWENIT
ncbi:MAG: hypothetical protein ABEK12_04215, partial [Candidatus Nanohaloarchaea archaeon]